jgi:hypothetical protein
MNRKQNPDKDIVPSASAAAAARTRRPASQRTKPSTAVSENPPAVSRSSEMSPGSAAYAVEQQLSHEEIARLAYSLWEARGCPLGNSEEDWLRAEQELRRRTPAQTLSS